MITFRSPFFVSCMLGLFGACLGGAAAAAPESVPPAPPAGAVPSAESETAPPTPATPPSPEATSEVSTDEPAASDVEKTIYVEVDLDGFDVDATTLRVAVAKELGVAIANAPTGSGLRLSIKAKRGGDLVVVFRAAAGTPGHTEKELMRVTAAPDDEDALVETAVLLVGNLARDEATTLLGAIEPTSKAAPETPVVDAPKSQDGETDTEPLTDASFNLTLFHPVTQLEHTEKLRLNFELGLFYSRIGGLDGGALNVGVLQVEQHAAGAQLAGLGLLNGKSASGARLAGFVVVGGGDFEGASGAGLADLNYGNLTGAQYAGLASMNMGSLRGAQLSSIVSINFGSLEGVQAAGLIAANKGAFVGAQIGGLAALAEPVPSQGVQIGGLGNFAGPLDGGQVAGLVNISGPLSGAQIAGLVNIAGEMNGAQIGLVNIGGRVRGLQLGLVNVADDVDGASIGLITYSRQGRVQPTFWYDSTQPINAGVRFYTGPLYAMPTLGYGRQAGKDEYSPGFSLGARIPVSRTFFDLDANYSNILTTSIDEHDINLRYRALAGFYLTDWFAIFAGGGVHHHFRTKGDKSQTFEPDFSVGLQFL